MKFIQLALSAATLAMLQSAHAATLAPDDSFGLPEQTVPLSTPAVFQDDAFSTPPPAKGDTSANFSGSLITNIYTDDPSNPFGGLTFTYQLSNDSTSTDSLFHLELLGFADFLVDASYFLIPDDDFTLNTVSRNSTGDRVSFGFSSGELLGGKNSEELILHTNAKYYTSRQATVNGIVSGKSESVSTFAPTNIPEPSSCVLIVAGAWLLNRRRRV